MGILGSKCLWALIHFVTEVFLCILFVIDFGVAQICSLHEIYMKTLFMQGQSENEEYEHTQIN